MKNWILIFNLVLTITLKSQTSSICIDGSFENSDFSNNAWTLKGYTITPGDNSVDGLNPISSGNSLNISNTTATDASNMLRWQYVTAGIDLYCSGINRVKTGNGLKALKLGNTQRFPSLIYQRRAEGISKTMLVTGNNYIVQFDFAQVVEYHDAFFSVLVNGVAVPIFYNNTSSINIIVPYSGYGCRNWTCAYVDLSAYIGQTISFEFLNRDCSCGNHSGYTYLDNIQCSNVSGCNTFPCCIEEKTYTASKFGFNRTLPVIVANNAQYQEIDFCSFEENNFDLPKSVGALTESQYDGIVPKQIYLPNPFNNGVNVVDGGHTGSKSLRIYQSLPYEYNVALIPDNAPSDPIFIDANMNLQIPRSKVYPMFSVLPDKKYKLSFWAKGEIISAQVASVFFKNTKSGATSSTISTTVLKSPSIENWQLYEVIIPVTKLDIAFYNSLAIQFMTSGPTSVLYIDDIKLVPEESTSKCYVYDDKFLRLTSELDENHFATFYDYDESGNLIRIRKETERGIVTLKESNFSYQKIK